MGLYGSNGDSLTYPMVGIVNDCVLDGPGSYRLVHEHFFRDVVCRLGLHELLFHDGGTDGWMNCTETLPGDGLVVVRGLNGLPCIVGCVKAEGVSSRGHPCYCFVSAGHCNDGLG